VIYIHTNGTYINLFHGLNKLLPENKVLNWNSCCHLLVFSFHINL